MFGTKPIFQDRKEAGLRLAEALRVYSNRSDVILLALPRGGVPIAYEISKALGIPFDIIIVRKLGVPGSEELAMGAIAEGDCVIYNEDMITEFRLTPGDIAHVLEKEMIEMNRRQRLYREGRLFPDLKGKTVIVVDDGIATGFTMRAALRAIRSFNPRVTVVAAPIAAPDVIMDLKSEADDVICLHSPEILSSIGQWYGQFDQLKDETVCELLKSSK